MELRPGIRKPQSFSRACWPSDKSRAPLACRASQTIASSRRYRFAIRRLALDRRPSAYFASCERALQKIGRRGDVRLSPRRAHHLSHQKIEDGRFATAILVDLLGIIGD